MQTDDFPVLAEKAGDFRGLGKPPRFSETREERISGALQGRIRGISRPPFGHFPGLTSAQTRERFEFELRAVRSTGSRPICGTVNLGIQRLIGRAAFDFVSIENSAMTALDGAM
jgi:hypothetical protein